MGSLTAWIDWTRTTLGPEEATDELARLSPRERANLDENHWVWNPGRVVWVDPAGSLKRARFTHGTHFRTAKGEFYVNSVGAVRRVWSGGES